MTTRKATYNKAYLDKLKTDPDRLALAKQKQREKDLRKAARYKALSEEEKKEYHAKRYRAFLARQTPEKIARRKEYRKAIIAKYNASDAAKRAALRYRQSAKGLETKRLYDKQKRDKQPNLLPLGEYMQRALLADPLFAQVNRIVPNKYPRDVRDDVVMEIVLAILEGTHTLETAQRSLSSFVPAHHKDSFKQVSLDAPIKGTDNLRLEDTIASDRFHF